MQADSKTPTMEMTPPLGRPRYLPFQRFDSIRNRILVFAVLATLIPSGITLGISYAQNRRALEEKITQDLLSESGQTARAMGVWLKERLYDLRVFAASDEVANSLQQSVAGATMSPTRGRLRDYLVSLHERFSDFEQLVVLDAGGRVLATSLPVVTPVQLPTEWQARLLADRQVVGDAYWDEKVRKGKLVIAVPVLRDDGRLLGALAAELNVAPMRGVLRSFARDSSGAVYLLSTGGALIASSDSSSSQLMTTTVPPAIFERLLAREDAVSPYISYRGYEVVGTLKRVPQVGWAVVAEVSADAAFQQVRRFRDFALLVVTLLLIAAAASAYRLGLLIARPLDRLTKGAAEVARGDLAVDLPAGGAGEVGYLTSVFNHMVSRLRAGRRELDSINETLRQKNEELERLSITDGLTGLANHRALMQRLEAEGVRFTRNEQPFSVLMADVDHFKQYNDTFGHPAGDEVLKKIAAIFRDSTRTVDCAARYGGEEFAIVMPETAIAGALHVAERIRSRVDAANFPGRKITLSIGIAEFPKDANSPQAIIAVADEALYRAKRGGRGRVVQAGGKTAKVKS